MSLLRFDPTTNDWVVFAPSRALRPHAVTRTRLVTSEPHVSGCPFCPGHESLTPPEIAATRRNPSDPASWQTRVISNKFPALRIEDDIRRLEDGALFRYMGGCGAHEVLVESPEHNVVLAQQTVDQISLILHGLQDRQRDLMRDHRFQAVIIFKNHGEGAGTSLQHPHWQLIATPVVPRMLRVKSIEAAEFFDREGACLYCRILEAELASGRRILASNDDFVALLPYASHSAFETWILPRRFQASFTMVEPAAIRNLAQLLKTVLLKLHTGLDNPDFNLTIDSAPRGDEKQEYFLWHLRILPRLATPAGFELGSGMSINTVMPEDAKDFLSEVPVANA